MVERSRRGYPGRFFSMHIQDVDLNATPRAQTPVGKGSIDWVGTFAAATVGGVRNNFVERRWS